LNEEIVQLVRDGLHGQNLNRLARLCEGLFGANPALYGTLLLVFRALAAEWDDQGIPTQRYETINGALRDPILDLMSSAGGPSDRFVDRLNEVFTAFMAVSA